MDEAKADAAAAAANQTCVAPVVFKYQQTTGYQRWADHAAAMGKGAAWKAWTEDEACPAKAEAVDTEAQVEATGYCALPTPPAR
jgi:hypothetical protein